MCIKSKCILAPSIAKQNTGNKNTIRSLKPAARFPSTSWLCAVQAGKRVHVHLPGAAGFSVQFTHRMFTSSCSLHSECEHGFDNDCNDIFSFVEKNKWKPFSEP